MPTEKVEPLSGPSLAQKLRALAPQKVRAFLLFEEIPEKLASTGEHTAKLYFNAEKHGMIRDFEDAKRAFHFIKEAWKDYVKVTLGDPRVDNIEIAFQVKKPAQ
jgi:hypothetical protein